MKEFRPIASMLLLALLGCSGRTAESAPPERPNVVLILTDDQRWDAMSCAGHPFLRTPNIDRLAREGVRFANAFCTTSLCSPSRASILSGLYAHTHRVLNNFTDFPASLPSYPRRLHESGYETAYIGKWHMGEDNDAPRPGFDYWMSHKGQGNYYDTTFNINGERQLLAGYITHRITEKAVDWIRKPHPKPFCLVVGHKAPHGPFVPEPKYAKAFDGIDIRRPATAKDYGEGKPDWVRQRVTTWHGLDGPLYKACGMADYEEFVRAYYATILSVDDSVGQVYEALRETGRLDRTLILFTTDNGYLLGEHGAIDKRAAWDESLRVPLVVRYPPLAPAARVLNEMVLHIDLAPTILEICGAPPLENIHGTSWARLLRGDGRGWRTAFLYEYNYETQFPYTPNVRGVRTDGWKLIRYPHGDGGPDRWKAEVYDLKDDPLETKNLVDDPSAAAKLKVLREEHERLKRETSDPDTMPIDEGIKQTLPTDAHRAVNRSGSQKP
ncbi:MAG TPA: sulfatase [Planctomycetota bacterium]|nr:sulfatase [Planctomycetota bacterium]